jgi:hypothetical protein
MGLSLEERARLVARWAVVTISSWRPDAHLDDREALLAKHDAGRPVRGPRLRIASG